MDEAFVEHAEHDVDGERCAATISTGCVASDCWKSRAVPAKLPWTVDGMRISPPASAIAVCRVAQRTRRAPD